jgi:hypothetical protein
MQGRGWEWCRDEERGVEGMGLRWFCRTGGWGWRTDEDGVVQD